MLGELLFSKKILAASLYETSFLFCGGRFLSEIAKLPGVQATFSRQLIQVERKESFSMENGWRVTADG
jgi:hypothetical protein